MTQQEALNIVFAYYLAYRGSNPEAIGESLLKVLENNVIFESPVVQAKFGGPVAGKVAIDAAIALAPFLKNVTIEASYASLDSSGVATLIHFPSPVGVIYQSEHFAIDLTVGKVNRIRSYYDPRKLLPSGS